MRSNFQSGSNIMKSFQHQLVVTQNTKKETSVAIFAISFLHFQIGRVCHLCADMEFVKSFSQVIPIFSVLPLKKALILIFLAQN